MEEAKGDDEKKGEIREERHDSLSLTKREDVHVSICFFCCFFHEENINAVPKEAKEKDCPKAALIKGCLVIKQQG